MREASFTTVFCGIESPEMDALVQDCLAGVGEPRFYADPSRTESAGVPRAAAG